jgi:hypothetical protein
LRSQALHQGENMIVAGGKGSLVAFTVALD